MTNRRQFLQITMATSAWGLISKAAAASGAVSQDEVPGFYKVIFDQRIPESRQFAGHLGSQGLDTYGMHNGDITRFWFRELDAVWRSSPVPLIGMTAPGPLFCLEKLAEQHGMRVVFKAEHQVNASNIPQQLIQHQLKGPESILQACADHDFTSAQNWPADMAELMLACPTGPIALDNTYIETPASSHADNLQTEKLISWIIAPARRLA